MTKSMLKTSDFTKFWTAIFQLGMVLLVLIASSFYSYVLFHTLAEIISVILAVSIFLVTWNARRFWGNGYYLVIGFGFLFSAVIDLFHAFEYKGIGIITANGSANIAAQLWLAGRLLIALSFLLAPLLGDLKSKGKLFFGFFASATILILLSIFYWKIFPAAYVDGIGLTGFKIYSEYFLMGLFLLAFYFFYGMRQEFHGRVFRLLSLVLILMTLTEFMFTLYIGVYDIFNLIGHLIRIVAYYLAYLAIVEFSLMKPYRTLFKDLKDKEVSLIRATQEWNLMFNSITDPAFILDTDHNVKCVNKAMCEFMGEDEKELVGKKCFEFMHKQNKPWSTCPMKTTCQSKKAHSEEIYDPAIGRTLLITTSPILDENEEIMGILHIAKDISQQKEIERAKDEFISLASHQLRTPLSSISLASELLVRGTKDGENNEQAELANEIFKSTKQMAALINHMLNVSRVELGTTPLKMNRIDFGKKIEEMLAELDGQIKDKKLKLIKEIKEGIELNFDENILRIIFENLLTNAIRYTPSEGKVTVKLLKDESGIKFSVSDTGCGIPKNQQKNIFQKSFRATNAKEVSDDGHGLGLYMVKSVVDKVGATIRFVSEENSGTTFIVFIPQTN